MMTYVFQVGDFAHLLRKMHVVLNDSSQSITLEKGVEGRVSRVFNSGKNIEVVISIPDYEGNTESKIKVSTSADFWGLILDK